MGVTDWLVVGLYFCILAGVAWWAIRRRQKTTADYFLAGRHVGWVIVGASLFASNIGSEHLVGLAGAGASSGVAMAHYELHAWCLLVLGWVLLPFYMRSGVFTMPEFLERRYGPAARWFLSIVSLVAYVFTKIAVGLFAGGIVFKALFPVNFMAGVDNFWVGAVGIVLVTGLYTIIGGLTTVIYTEAIQTVVFILGSAAVSLIGLYKLGGLPDAEATSGLLSRLGEGWSQLYQICGSEHFNLWKPIDDPKFPWLGMLFGAPIVGLWYWCTDQYIVQRTLAAANATQARRGTIFGAYLKLLPLFIFIVPGMIALALSQKGLMSRGVQTDTNQAFPLLVVEMLPIGLKGLVVAGLLAALMSSLASVFNSSATLFTMDVYQKINPQASEAKLVWVGRVATGVMVLLGLAWIPFILHLSDSLYGYLQSVQAYIAPPIFAVFFLGLFIRRINLPGCMAGLVGGFVLGMARLVSELNKGRLAGTWLHGFADLNFLYFCIVLFVASVVIIVTVSLLTAPPRPEQLAGLTYATQSSEDRREVRAGWNRWDVFHTVMILVLIGVVYLSFNG